MSVGFILGTGQRPAPTLKISRRSMTGVEKRQRLFFNLHFYLMTIASILADKNKRVKEKTKIIADCLLNHSIKTEELILLLKTLKNSDKATCIEAVEYASKQNPNIVDKNLFSYLSSSLKEKAPRIKWESAKAIGNVVHLFSKNLDEVICNLLDNTENKGTVVRWAIAYALGEILKLKTKHNKDLLPTIEAIILIEENNGVRKKYLDAVKKVK